VDYSSSNSNNTNGSKTSTSTSTSAAERIEVTKRLTNFINGVSGTSSDSDNKKKDNFLKTKNTNTTTTTQRHPEDMFSPLVSDIHLTIHPNSNVVAQPLPNANANVVMPINNGIQLPTIEWHAHFRKGYSLLLWMRLHPHTEDTMTMAPSPTNADDNDNNDNTETQILYRFAQSAFPQAHGIQATLHRDTSITDTHNGTQIPCVLRIETLRPPSPSKIDSPGRSHDNGMHCNSMTTPMILPASKWCLVGIQHSFPYLKRPTCSITLDGVEVSKGEVAYPTLGNDMGECMRDNYILCNLPSVKYKTPASGSAFKSSIDNSDVDATGIRMVKAGSRRYASSHLELSSVDFGGVGLYKESIPTLIQGIIAEHGPCRESEGVIPRVPPVVQNRDALVLGSNHGNGSSNSHGNSGSNGGPFGLASNRPHGHGHGQDGKMRSMGIPLCTGIMISSFGSYEGEVLLQKLLSKLVLGVNASRAIVGNSYSNGSGNSSGSENGHKITIPVSRGCQVGNTADVPKVGIIQPKEPHGVDGHAASTKSTPRSRGRRIRRQLIPTVEDSNDEEKRKNAICIGNVKMFHATYEYLDREREVTDLGEQNYIPTYHLPSSAIIVNKPIPSFIHTLESINPIGYILQCFHLALPPPGYPHHLQTALYHQSFDRLHDLIIYKDGIFAAHLMEFMSSILSLGGRARDRILQSGVLHTLSTLLRRVLLRALRLGMLTEGGRGQGRGPSNAHMSMSMSTNSNAGRKELWQIYANRETPNDSLSDTRANTAPSYIPPLIVKSMCNIISACCGPSIGNGTSASSGKRPPLAYHIRRASDLALTAVFGLALDNMDLWGCDAEACATILSVIVDRYCLHGDGGEQTENEIGDKFDCGYGRLLRLEINIQYVVDIIRIRYGDSPTSTPAYLSLSTSLNRIIYRMLKYSLSSSRTLSQGEYDIHSMVGAISDCPLGSIVCHAIVDAIMKLLVYCEIFPLGGAEDGTDAECISDILDGGKKTSTKSSSNGKSKRTRESDLKLKRIKSDIAGRLARNLLLSQFHNVVTPLLLSRAIFDGRRVNNSGASGSTSEAHEGNKRETEEVEEDSDWRGDWRSILHIFMWLTSIAGSEGIKSARDTGLLLLHSGRAGSLHRCLHTHHFDLLRVMVPPFPSPTSAVPPGSFSDGSGDVMEVHMMDMCNRLKVSIHLLGGLTASLLSSEDNNEDMGILSAFLHGISTIAFHLLNSRYPLITKSQGQAPAMRPRVMEKPDVVVALELGPPLITCAVLLEEKIQHLRRSEQYISDVDSDSWDLMESPNKEPLAINSSEDHCIEEQMRKLNQGQTQIMHLAGVLLARAMSVGGGEASTLVWRNIIASLNLHSTNTEQKEGEEDGKELASKQQSHVSNNLLCRLTSIVLNLILSRRSGNTVDSNPWASVELCSATARMCDLVEEKKLLQVQADNDDDAKYSRFTLDQVRLLCSLLKIMETGRENTGWCQLDLPHPPDQRNMQPEGGEKDAGGGERFYPSLVAAFRNQQEGSASTSSSKYIDLDMLSEKDEIYHILIASGSVPAVDLDVGGHGYSTNNSSISSSRMLLPILQPTLRIVLSCLESVKGVAVAVRETSLDGDTTTTKKETDSLHSIIIMEVTSTITAAIVGLAFSNARDVCLNTLSVLRRCISIKKTQGDDVVVKKYRQLFMVAMQEMQVRYTSERSKREMAQVRAYSDDDAAPSSSTPKGNAENEAVNSNKVEMLLMGNALIHTPRVIEVDPDSTPLLSHQQVNHNENDDFILFPHRNGDDSKDVKATPNSLGWNNYKGFGQALEEACTIDTAKNHDNTTVEATSQIAMNDLAQYLDAWDERQVMDDEESELVELFDTQQNLGNRFDITASPVGLSQQRVTSLSYANAADSMTAYIELASAESMRRSDIQGNLYPSRRNNCISFAHAQCWTSFMELFYYEQTYGYGRQLFERCMADGGRDYGGRLISVPIHPQFSRTIPSQLDNSLVAAASMEANDGEIDLDGLNSLVQRGSIKILDITKKQEKDSLEEDDDMDGSGNVLVSKPSMDSAEISLLDDFGEEEPGELFLGFPDRSKDDENTTTKINLDHCDDNISTEAPGTPGRRINGEDNLANAADMTQADLLAHQFCMSTFANPPNTSSASLQGQNTVQNISALSGVGYGAANHHYDSCLHIRAEGNRKGTIFVTSMYLVFEYDDPSGLYEEERNAIEELEKKIENDDTQKEDRNSDYDQIIQHYKKIAALRPKSVRWNIFELSHVYLRRYRLRDSALEMFFIPSGGSPSCGPGLSSAMSSILLDFGPGNKGNELRDNAANAIMSRAPTSTVKQWPEKSSHFLHEHLRNITIGWVKGRVNNFDYLMALNCLSGRSFNDLCQYPVFPWVLSNYTSEEIPDLNDESNFRDLTKPMGALNPQRLQEFLERFETFDDPVIPSFMYGSHYSTSAGVVLHFLVRMHPFASLHRQLQGGHFDVADRLFNSIARSWDMCTGQSAAEVKELTPEWYCNPTFLRNENNFKLGASQDGEVIGDVQLPPWATGSPDKFVEVLRCALESDICTSMLPDWIDLIFGRKQQGPEAVEANNVFFYLTYYGSCDVASIEDEDMRIATELQIAHFGQCPMQLFWRPHVKKLSRQSLRRKATLSDILGVYDLETLKIDSQTNRKLPFQSAPISHWVHLFAPPPGPHAPLISLRLVFPDRCVAVDAQGIFHFFRWAWKADLEASRDERSQGMDQNDLFTDVGYFVAQRELTSFRSVPRLVYSPPVPSKCNWLEKKDFAVVTISKGLFAAQSLLVISDGDGRGGLCFQLADPSKGLVQGEVFISAVHSSRVSAIHMDTIGTAAGVGGAGGELAVVGSDDGTASVWRFISNASCHLPLRPRLRLGGHQGNRIHAVAANSRLNICATVSGVRCCIHNLSNGNMIRSIAPPIEDLSGFSNGNGSTVECETSFISSNAVCITQTAFIILVCHSRFRSTGSDKQREIISLQLFNLEGVHIGSKALESWRGIPNKITSTNDGKAVMVCSGRGISVHLVSTIKPLQFIDEWQIGGDDDTTMAAYDIDFGPSPSRPVVACTGLSSGALRIHALKGISEWSEENKKGTVTEAVGSVLGTVKGTGSKMVGLVKGTGSRVVGLGTEIGGEAVRGVRMKGVTGFLGDVFGKKMDP